MEIEGMMQNDEKPAKNPRITVVLTPELEKRLHRAAARLYTPPSVLVRQWIVRGLEEHERRDQTTR